MSTIEKAAARLASRQKAKTERSPRRVIGDGSGDEPPGPVSALPGADRAFEQPFRAPLGDRFCDIDLPALKERGFLTPEDGNSQLAQEMRRIKRPLLLNIQKLRARGEVEPPPNLIMITSALPGEGKTFVATNLAMSIAAEVDKRVLLVDADVAKGDVSRQFQLGSRRGVSDLLSESNYLAEDGVLDTNIDRLSILPSGTLTDQIDELFASRLMAGVIGALADTDPDRVVLFDASPLLATTEAAVLAEHMGQIVVVVEANKTPQSAVGQALAVLEGRANVSLVLNKTTGHGSGGYSYGYGYGDASGRRYGQHKEAG